MNLHSKNPKSANNTSELVSVVLPVYNGEKFIAEAIQSILCQSYKNFEFIIIDDGSTDETLRILREFKGKDSRIHLVSRENKGLVATLNEGIDLACGKWIARMDADDIALPQRFERQLQWLGETGADICGAWVNLFGTADKRVLRHPQSDDAIKVELLFGTPFAHPSVIMKTDLVRKLRYDKAWEKAEDYDLWERAARQGWKMTNVQEVLLLYRQHATQTTMHFFDQNQLLSQKIRRRYWEFVFNGLHLPQNWIEEVMKIRDTSPIAPNMDSVDAAFYELLKHSQGEAREVIFDHVTRLYFRVASHCPDVVARWSKLNKYLGGGYGFGIRVKLWLLSLFRIRSNSSIFFYLKKCYISLFQ